MAKHEKLWDRAGVYCAVKLQPATIYAGPECRPNKCNRKLRCLTKSRIENRETRATRVERCRRSSVLGRRHCGRWDSVHRTLVRLERETRHEEEQNRVTDGIRSIDGMRSMRSIDTNERSARRVRNYQWKRNRGQAVGIRTGAGGRGQDTSTGGGPKMRADGATLQTTNLINTVVKWHANKTQGVARKFCLLFHTHGAINRT